MQKFLDQVEIPFLGVVNLTVKGKNCDAVNENNQMGQRKAFAELG